MFHQIGECFAERREDFVHEAVREFVDRADEMHSRLEPELLALLGRDLADLAGIAILQAQAATDARRRDEQLQFALDSRIVIEQAKGMLVENAHIDMATAFDHIRALSRNTNTKLTDIATQIVDGRIDLDALVTDASDTR